MIICFRTGNSGQSVQNQIRLLLKDLIVCYSVCLLEASLHGRTSILALQIEYNQYSVFFTRFNKAYLVNLYKIKLVDPWDKNLMDSLQSIHCNGCHVTWLLSGTSQEHHKMM